MLWAIIAEWKGVSQALREVLGEQETRAEEPDRAAVRGSAFTLLWEWDNGQFSVIR